MRQISLEELRQIQLEILSDVDVFCKNKGIKYSLCGGTLLGAVRHKGYIPWDDDIDLMMPREDYERFAKEYHSQDNELLDLRKSEVTVEICLKVCRRGTVMTDISFGRSLWGINIDIFPIDGAPMEYDEHCRKVLALREKLSWVCPFYKAIPSNKALWFAKYILKRLRHCCFDSSLNVKKEIEKLACCYPFSNSPKAGVILGSYGSREVVDKTVFDEITDLPFEGCQYPAIKDFHSYLSAVYGDYMQLPPLEKRVTHHLYDSFILS
ncbi:MAG: LicD family protein [Bacteroidales bacterium]|nr:LicD family protein [Bacteroidales bacterium]